MTAQDDVHDHAHEHHHDIPFVGKYVFSTDHKVIGIQFLMIGLLFMPGRTTASAA